MQNTRDRASLKTNKLDTLNIYNREALTTIDTDDLLEVITLIQPGQEDPNNINVLVVPNDGDDIKLEKAALIINPEEEHLQRQEEEKIQNEKKFKPGTIVWGKVEGHEWWPALVVRRRAVPLEVGGPSGGAAEVMSHTPVVFFTPNGIPKEVEMGFESELFALIICQRYCGITLEDEAEYAWLSKENIKEFTKELNTSKGMESADPQLLASIEAAKEAMDKISMPNVEKSEDSDGGWQKVAEYRKSRRYRKKRRQKRRAKSSENPFEIESDDNVEMAEYDKWELQPKIEVEQIYGCRTHVDSSDLQKSILEKEADEEKALNLNKLNIITEKLNERISLDLILLALNNLELKIKTNKSQNLVTDLDSEPDLCASEKDAVDTLLNLSHPQISSKSHSSFPTISLPFTSQSQFQDIHNKDNEIEYLVKYANRSHLHNEWVIESTLIKIAKKKLFEYKQKLQDGLIPNFQDSWSKPERIITRRKSKKGPGWEVLVKWEGLPYNHCSWEAETSLLMTKPESVILYIAMWERQRRAIRFNTKRIENIYYNEILKNQSNFITFTNNPYFIYGPKFYSYQLEIMNWCRKRWLYKLGGILIGEHGLGKTAALIGFMQSVRHEYYSPKPFLIVASKEQCKQWKCEISFWTGFSVEGVIFDGNPLEIPYIREYEIYQKLECMDGKIPCSNSKKILKADIILTTLETLENEITNLTHINWDMVILDTRDMSRKSSLLLLSLLTQFKTCVHYVLTPSLPVSEAQLLKLLNFINPNSLIEIKKEKSTYINKNEYLEKLDNAILKDTLSVSQSIQEQHVKELVEIRIPVPLTEAQRHNLVEVLLDQYQMLVDEYLHKCGLTSIQKLHDMISNQMLICNHAQLRKNRNKKIDYNINTLKKFSSKLFILDLAIKELRKENKKIMILTQTLQIFEILLNYIKINYGPDAVIECNENDTSYTIYNNIKDFNDKNNTSFIFLTMPKCCGLNLYLPEISCVFIFDSNLNYMSDLAALSQASQIGHDVILPVFRLFIADSVDNKILTLSQKKSDILSRMFFKDNYILGNTKISNLDEKIMRSDFKLLEEILICSNQFLSDKSIEKDDFDLYMPDLTMKTAYRNIAEDDIKAILDETFKIKDNKIMKNGCLSGSSSLSHIKYTFRYCRFIQNEINEEIDEVEFKIWKDSFIMAKLWDRLLFKEWELHLKKQRNLFKNQKSSMAPKKIKLKQGVPNMTVSGNSGGPQVILPSSFIPKTAADAKNVKKVQFILPPEIEKSKTRKRQQDTLTNEKTAKRLAIELPTIKKPISYPLDLFQQYEYDLSYESLLNCKAHQDVFMQILGDPMTLEGETALEAFKSIDKISKELTLPEQISQMAKQIAEILLTMRTEEEHGRHFQDYTLISLIAFTCYLKGYKLGDNYGLDKLSTQYQHDLNILENVFYHIRSTMLGYKYRLIKIKQIDDRNKELYKRYKGKWIDEMPAVSYGTVPVSGSYALSHQEGLKLHLELDRFIHNISDILKQNYYESTTLPAHVLDESPGSAICGQKPYEWFPTSSVSVNLELSKEARNCDVDMYLIEKSHEIKTKNIEKSFQELQNKVRDYGIKTIEKVKNKVIDIKSDIKNKQIEITNKIRFPSSPPHPPLKSLALQTMSMSMSMSMPSFSQLMANFPLSSNYPRFMQNRINNMERSINSNSNSNVIYPDYKTKGFVGFIPRMIPMTLTLSQPSTTIRRPNTSSYLHGHRNHAQWQTYSKQNLEPGQSSMHMSYIENLISKLPKNTSGMMSPNSQLNPHQISNTETFDIYPRFMHYTLTPMTNPSQLQVVRPLQSSMEAQGLSPLRFQGSAFTHLPVTLPSPFTLSSLFTFPQLPNTTTPLTSTTTTFSAPSTFNLALSNIISQPNTHHINITSQNYENLTYGQNMGIKKLKISESELPSMSMKSSYDIDNVSHLIRENSNLYKRQRRLGSPAMTSRSNVMSTSSHLNQVITTQQQQQQMIGQAIEISEEMTSANVGEKRKAVAMASVTPIAAALQALTSTCQVEVNVSDQRVYRQSRPNLNTASDDIVNVITSVPHISSDNSNLDSHLNDN